MRNQILINTTFNETRVALVEDKILKEFYVERDLNPQMVGNIYKGTVERIVPGMQAAFVDIGSGKSGFISVEDVHNESFYEYISEEEKSELKVSSNNLIQEKLVQGQDIIVQVVKEPVQAKGPKLTSYISIPGKCLVLIASIGIVGISHKIDNEKERNRLLDIINRHKPLPNRILRAPQKGGSQGHELIGTEHRPHACQRAEDARQDIGGHLHQTLAGIIQRQILMLVFVEPAQINLAYALDRCVPEHLRERPHLQSPVTGNSI